MRLPTENVRYCGVASWVVCSRAPPLVAVAGQLRRSGARSVVVTLDAGAVGSPLPGGAGGDVAAPAVQMTMRDSTLSRSN